MLAAVLLTAFAAAGQPTVELIAPRLSPEQRAAAERAVDASRFKSRWAPGSAASSIPAVRSWAEASARTADLAKLGREAFFAARFASTPEIVSQAFEAAGPWAAHPVVRRQLIELLLFQEAAGGSGLDRALALMPEYQLDAALWSPSLRKAWSAKAAKARSQRRVPLQLQVQPPDASVFVDGAFVPNGARLEVLPGRHDVFAWASGHAPLAQPIEVSADRPAALQLQPLEDSACLDGLDWAAADAHPLTTEQLSACATQDGALAAVALSPSGDALELLAAGACSEPTRRLVAPGELGGALTALLDTLSRDCALRHEAPSRLSVAPEVTLAVSHGLKVASVHASFRLDGGAWSTVSCSAPCASLVLPLGPAHDVSTSHRLEYWLSALASSNVAADFSGSASSPTRLALEPDVRRRNLLLAAGLSVAGAAAVAAVVVGVVLALQPAATNIGLGRPPSP